MQETKTKTLNLDEKKEIMHLTRYFTCNLRKDQLVKSLKISREEIYTICFLISSLLVLTKNHLPKNDHFFEKTLDFHDVIFDNERYGNWEVTLNFSKNLFKVLEKVNHRDFYIINKNNGVFNQLEEFFANDPSKIFIKICEYLLSKTLEKIAEKKIVTWYLWIVYPELKIYVNRTSV